MPAIKSPNAQAPKPAPAADDPKQMGWLEAARQALTHRLDTEHEVAYARVALTAFAMVCFLLTAPTLLDGLLRGRTFVAFAALLMAVGLLAHIVWHPEVSTRRRYLSLVLDQLFVTAIVATLGAHGAWALPLYMMVSVGNSLRFGRDYGLAASAVGALGFVAVRFLDREYWHLHQQFADAMLVTMLVVPGYVALLGHRMDVLNEQYRSRVRKMRRAATEDALTGLANRAYFRRHLKTAVDRAMSTESPEPFAILYLDLDGFKSVNDTHGHHVGDLLLKQVARVVKAGVRGSDVVARLGGDEFAIVMRGIRDPEIAERIGNGIVHRVKAIDRIDGKSLHISCSAGLTMVGAPLDPSKRIEDLMARADWAMYQAKRAGKNQLFLQPAQA